jgi:hypothetical protein
MHPRWILAWLGEWIIALFYERNAEESRVTTLIWGND